MEREGKGGEGRGEEAYTGNVAEETLCLKCDTTSPLSFISLLEMK